MKNNVDYLMGVDQGATKTIALVCDTSGYILGVGYDSGLISAYYADTEKIYAKRIKAACEKACVAAGIIFSQVSAVCGCVNGADWDFEYPIWEKELRETLSIDDVIILNDCIGAMRGGSISANCAVVCAGSGLNAAVRREDGKEIIYGYYINNMHQGGSALGAAALQKVFDSDFGLCGPTMLTDLILNYTGHNSAEALLKDLSMNKYNLARKDIAPLLLRAYADGDVEANAIINEFSIGVSRYITVGAKRLDMENTVFDLVFSGSVFKNIGKLIAEEVFRSVQKEAPEARIVHAKLEPVCGAALTLLDKEYAGATPEKVYDVFKESARKSGLERDLRGI